MWRRFAWFVGLWMLGVVTLGLVAGVLKAVLHVAAH
ncbi:DUF2474 domain-containing protein [Paraburkholderia phenoliruptrix]|nr:DUF2474 domain-containing protein [Paraburkholderia phenoliruptrix]MBW9127718.1 DUF2474 domain-containing protein [Paraburkholderia ginsengiterrae]